MAAGASAQTLTQAPTPPRRAETAPIAKAVTLHAQSNLQLDRLAARSLQGGSGGENHNAGPEDYPNGAAVGATAGFFAGGYLGAWIHGDCGGCDDPGFKGFLIGMPIGAACGTPAACSCSNPLRALPRLGFAFRARRDSGPQTEVLSASFPALRPDSLLLPSLAFAQAPDAGRQVFATRCAACHGTEGAGGELGPSIIAASRCATIRISRR